VWSYLFADKIKIYCKGADNVIYQRSTQASIKEMWGPMQKHLLRYAVTGLRTLVCAYKVIPGEVYDKWAKGHAAAQRSMENRKALVAESASAIESDLTLVGATAIEDRLQEGVPETIAILAKVHTVILCITTCLF